MAIQPDKGGSTSMSSLARRIPRPCISTSLSTITILAMVGGVTSTSDTLKPAKVV